MDVSWAWAKLLVRLMSQRHKDKKKSEREVEHVSLSLSGKELVPIFLESEP
jgi:hypothetical protein